MGTTTKYGLPYPEPTTLITESAAIVKDLAEKIDAALSAVAPSTAYTVPGTLVQAFTASGTFTPPAGVTVVDVVVIGGGGNGGTGNYGSGAALRLGLGGTGGGVRVFRNVPVSGPVAVTVGGPVTASTFGALTAPGGSSAGIPGPSTAGWSVNASASGGGAFGQRGQDGPTVNGTHYAGGAGGAWADNNSPSNAKVSNGGGAGGGGQGAALGNIGSWFATAGAPGTGGGGGGGANWYSTGDGGAAVGGSGRVMIFTAQTFRAARGTDQYAPAVPELVATLDDTGTVTGVYAVRPDDNPPHTVPYPAQPVDTGRTVTVLVDPADPGGPTHDTPVMAWPTLGWTYTGNTWKEPTT